jgi:hypothetical protein
MDTCPPMPGRDKTTTTTERTVVIPLPCAARACGPRARSSNSRWAGPGPAHRVRGAIPASRPDRAPPPPGRALTGEPLPGCGRTCAWSPRRRPGPRRAPAGGIRGAVGERDITARWSSRIRGPVLSGGRETRDRPGPGAPELAASGRGARGAGRGTRDAGRGTRDAGRGANSRAMALGSLAVPGRPEQVSPAWAFVARTLGTNRTGADADAATLLTSAARLLPMPVRMFPYRACSHRPRAHHPPRFGDGFGLGG